MKASLVVLSILLACIGETYPCTIFVASYGGNVLVGNNEDYIPSICTWLWMRPSEKQANGYVFWGFDEKYPEGGINERGLFIDAAALPVKIEILKDPAKPDFSGYLVEKVLRECASVEEVVTLVRRYNLTWQEKAQILVADRSGDYAVIHANYIIRKSGPVFVLTNYSLDSAHDQGFSCWRRNTAYAYLRGPHISVAGFRNILSKTAQVQPDNATVYSQVCDLKKGIVYLYRLHDYSTADTIDLAKALLRGRRQIAISSLFPRSIGDTIRATVLRSGLRPALALYNRLKNGPKASSFNFSEGALDRVGYSLLNEGHREAALTIFELNSRLYPLSGNARAGLGNAYLVAGRDLEADSMYLKAGERDPGGIYPGLFERHPDSIVSFRIKGFEGAKKITVFLKEVETGSEMKASLTTPADDRGDWRCRIKMAPGAYTYSFNVDETWIVDPGNKLAKKNGKFWSSLLIVRAAE